MKMNLPTLNLRRLALVATSLTAAIAAEAADAYKWSVQYIIDQSRGIAGRSQKVYPRSSRAVAGSPDGKYVYVGYIKGGDNQGEVRKIDVAQDDFERATLRVLRGPIAKAITVDDRGRVYITDETAVEVWDGELNRRQAIISTSKCEGITVVRDGGELVLYGTEREDNEVKRWVLTEKGDEVVGGKLAGFEGPGVFKVAGARELRGIEVDANGSLWVADFGGNKVWRISKDGKDVQSVEVKTPLDIAFDGGRAFVTCYRNRTITVLNDSLQPIGNLNVPWDELEISMYGNNRNGALAGIASVPGGGLWITNEGGQTANQRSLYGRADDRSGTIDGKFYRDVKDDDNEPLLRATPVAQ